MKEWAPKEVEYYPTKYKTAASGNYDIYVLFVERAVQLLSDKGLFGFIMPHKFFQAEYGANLRKLIADGKLLREIVNFTDQQVFDQATTYTHLLFLSKASKKEFKYAEISKLENPVSQLATIKKNEEYENHAIRVGKLQLSSVTEKPWQFGLGAEANILGKLKDVKPHLEQVSENIFVGTQTSADDIFVLEEAKKDGDFFVGYSKSLGREVKVESAAVKPFLKGREIRKYCFPSATTVLICPYDIQEDQFQLLTEKELSSKYPHAYSYLKENKQKLTEREGGKMKGDRWYAYGYPKSMTLFQRTKLIVPDYNNSAAFTFDEARHFYKTGYGIILKKEFSYLYVLGLLNSKLLFKYLLLTGTKLRGGYVRFWTQFIKGLPIKVANTKAEKEAEEKICELVKKILDLNKKKQTTDDKSKIELLEREAKVYEEKIDRLVYELYGLTEEEIKIVEARG